MAEDSQMNRLAFPATPWSLIGRAVDAGNTNQKASFEELLRRYLPALRAHLIYSKKMPLEQAEDLLQNFITDKVIERGIFASAQQEKGKFRTFLLTALTRYHISEVRKRSAQKRSAETGAAELLEDCDPPASDASPSSVFDTAWAKELVAEATRRTEAECAKSGQETTWKLLKARVLDPAMDNIEPVEYKELAAKFKLSSPVQVSNMLVTGKRMYLRNLRNVIGEYAKSEEEIEEELRDLRSVLAGAG